MKEAGAPSTDSLACGRSVVPTPPGVVMLALPTVPRNAKGRNAKGRKAKGRKAKAAPGTMGRTSAARGSIIESGAPKDAPD